MNQTAGSIKRSLFALTAKGIKYDLDRIVAAAALAGNPQNACPSIHVAGTNGKGSTCTYIEAVLREAGYTTGLFTSPHILLFEERFRINGTMVAEKEWVAVYHDQRQVIESCNLTFFEATMLIGSELFRRRGVEWAVFETGLGGRFDATNILRPRVSVITHLAMDHADLLGNTLPAIAGEKLGIVKDKIPLVIADTDDPAVRSRIGTVCREKNASVAIVNEDGVSGIECTSSGNAFSRNGIRYTTRMTGRFQIVNALLAIEALQQLNLNIAPDTMQRGIANATIQGRFQQLVVNGKAVVLDVGHNPDAADALCTALGHRFPGKTICLVAGIMADKDYPSMIVRYGSIARHIILTRPNTDRAAAAETLARHVPPTICSIHPEVADAVRIALGREEDVVCITGSFYTVGEAVGCGLLNVDIV